jgi:hypothetical protein
MPEKVPHDDQGNKRCSSCKTYKVLDDFTKSSKTWDGRFDKCRSCLKEYRHERSEKDKEYRRNNRDKVNQWNRNSYNRGVSINIKIKENLARRMRLLIAGQKSLHTEELIGCSSDDLKLHLESTFKNGMSWENYGVHGWHIDHIIPCANFDQTSIEDQKICWNYKNLQALWAVDNLKKGARCPGNNL